MMSKKFHNQWKEGGINQGEQTDGLYIMSVIFCRLWRLLTNFHSTLSNLVSSSHSKSVVGNDNKEPTQTNEWMDVYGQKVNKHNKAAHISSWIPLLNFTSRWGQAAEVAGHCELTAHPLDYITSSIHHMDSCSITKPLFLVQPTIAIRNEQHCCCLAASIVGNDQPKPKRTNRRMEIRSRRSSRRPCLLVAGLSLSPCSFKGYDYSSGKLKVARL